LIGDPKEVSELQLTYDPTRNIAYLRLREPAGAQVETIKLSDEVNIDLAPDGSVYGIELLNADAQLGGADHGRLVLDLGKTRLEVPLLEPA
jgi:uncharacterized protein YuzE